MVVLVLHILSVVGRQQPLEGVLSALETQCVPTLFYIKRVKRVTMILSRDVANNKILEGGGADW